MIDTFRIRCRAVLTHLSEGSSQASPLGPQLKRRAVRRGLQVFVAVEQPNLAILAMMSDATAVLGHVFVSDQGRLRFDVGIPSDVQSIALRRFAPDEAYGPVPRWSQLHAARPVDVEALLDGEPSARAEDLLGYTGRRLSSSKSRYRERHPAHDVVFNARVYDTREVMIWQGDLDLTASHEQLQTLADDVGGLLIRREGPLLRVADADSESIVDPPHARIPSRH
jgi:hypothetical protein